MGHFGEKTKMPRSKEASQQAALVPDERDLHRDPRLSRGGGAEERQERGFLHRVAALRYPRPSEAILASIPKLAQCGLSPSFEGDQRAVLDPSPETGSYKRVLPPPLVSISSQKLPTTSSMLIPMILTPPIDLQSKPPKANPPSFDVHTHQFVFTFLFFYILFSLA